MLRPPIAASKWKTYVLKPTCPGTPVFRQNAIHRRKRTDTSMRTPIHGPFSARCDMCGKEYVYKRSEVLRIERELPEGFIPVARQTLADFETNNIAGGRCQNSATKISSAGGRTGRKFMRPSGRV